jgi:hypothetical protein
MLIIENENENTTKEKKKLQIYIKFYYVDHGLVKSTNWYFPKHIF